MGWSCWPRCQFAHSLSRCSSWLGAASAGLSPQQPAGHLGAEAQLWAKTLVATLFPPALCFPCGSALISFHEPYISELPSAVIQLLLSVLAAGIHPHSLPVLAAHFQHQGHPTLGSPHAGPELSQGQTRAMMLKDSTSTVPQPSHSRAPVTLGGQCGTGSSAAALEKLLLGPGGFCPSAAQVGMVQAPPLHPGGQCAHLPAVTTPIPPGLTALCSSPGAGDTGARWLFSLLVSQCWPWAHCGSIPVSRNVARSQQLLSRSPSWKAQGKKAALMISAHVSLLLSTAVT